MSLIYTAALDDLLDGDLELDSVSVRALLVKDSYTPSAAHEDLADIAAGHRIGTAVALGSVTITDGVFDAANTSFSSVAAGSTAAAVVLYVHTGTEGTSRLIAYIDGIYQFPYVTTGGDITINWPSTGILRLRPRT